MTVKVTYGGETIVRGDLGRSNLMFWNKIEVEDSVDMSRLSSKLLDIYYFDGVHSSIDGRQVHLPPAFKVEPDDALEQERTDSRP